MRELRKYIRKVLSENLNDNFRIWFGDSKVVNSSGEPLMVHHGTSKKFSSFNLSKATQKIIWFTSNKSSVESGEVGAQGKGHIMDLYACIKNPAGWNEYEKYGLGQLENMGYDGAILPDPDGTITGFVFKSSQLKSNANKGEWDGSNKNIFKEEDGRLLGKSLATQTKNTYVVIYRAAAMSANAFVDRDYVTLSKKFAVEHAENNHVYYEETQHVIQALVSPEYVFDAYNPGEYFYSGPEKKGKEIYVTKGEDYEEYDLNEGIIDTENSKSYSFYMLCDKMCDTLGVEAKNKMISDAYKISDKEFVSLCEHSKELIRYLNNMSDDPSHGFYKSAVNNKECCYLLYAGFEFIFIKDGESGQEYWLDESSDNKNKYTVADKEAFKDVLLDLATLDLEDGQVRYPKVDNKKMKFLFGGNKYYIYILNKDSMPASGPFELVIENDDDEVIGFIRGTKSGNIISFNLIHIQEDSRGFGIGTDIYEKLLNQGFIIKSDSEITDSTYGIYDKLLIYGYKPLLFDDGTVGLIK